MITLAYQMFHKILEIRAISYGWLTIFEHSNMVTINIVGQNYEILQQKAKTTNTSLAHCSLSFCKCVPVQTLLFQLPGMSVSTTYRKSVKQYSVQSEIIYKYSYCTDSMTTSKIT